MEDSSQAATQAHHEKVVAAHLIHPSIKQRLWLNTFLIAVTIFALVIYGFFLLDGGLSLYQISKALGATAALCLAVSFSFSSWCYYFNFLDRHLIYRKYFGLVGYFIALLHSLTLPLVDPARYYSGLIQHFWSADVILGLTAMGYFTFMALISNTWAIKKMTGKYWRWALRGGFAAWALLAIRAFVLEKSTWLYWLTTYQGFPPPRLLLSILVIVIIALRLSIEVSKLLKKKAQLEPPLNA